MYKIELEIGELARRSSKISEMMAVLRISPKRTGKGRYRPVACDRAGAYQGDFILSVHDGNNSEAYRHWRFATYKEGFYCMYFEVWRPKDEKKIVWQLFQLAFSLYRKTSHKDPEREVIAIHCDPLEDSNAPHAQYKSSPHLHVVMSGDPLPHAHFGLNLGHIKEVMSEVESLSKAIKIALRMVKDQVVDLEW